MAAKRCFSVSALDNHSRADGASTAACLRNDCMSAEVFQRPSSATWWNLILSASRAVGAADGVGVGVRRLRLKRRRVAELAADSQEPPSACALSSAHTPSRRLPEAVAPLAPSRCAQNCRPRTRSPPTMSCRWSSSPPVPAGAHPRCQPLELVPQSGQRSPDNLRRHGFQCLVLGMMLLLRRLCHDLPDHALAPARIRKICFLRGLHHRRRRDHDAPALEPRRCGTGGRKSHTRQSHLRVPER